MTYLMMTLVAYSLFVLLDLQQKRRVWWVLNVILALCWPVSLLVLCVFLTQKAYQKFKERQEWQ